VGGEEREFVKNPSINAPGGGGGEREEEEEEEGYKSADGFQPAAVSPARGVVLTDLQSSI
jgi:hypothetical protein